MRKPRDFDRELKALKDKARSLKAQKVQQLGELVILTGADALSPDELAGALVAVTETKEIAKKEAWARRGTAFFRGQSRGAAAGTDPGAGSSPEAVGGAQPAPGGQGTQ